jgi:DAK2 domain fusion protein YloV
MPGTLDPTTLRRALWLFLDALRQHEEELNSLNVYPVPDGDTGTNLVLTQEAVVAAVAALGDQPSGFADLGTVVAQASLMGARGNSGVILSQVLRGLFERFPSNGRVGGDELAAALEHAGAEAHRAVARPAEGTVLSVLRDAGRAAVEAAGRDPDGGASGVIESALTEARASLDRTREIHPDLRRAKVVDAGGKGIVLFLDAVRAALWDQPLSEPAGPMGPLGGEGAAGAGVPTEGFDPGSHPRYEVQYLLEASDHGIPALRRALGDLGDSLVVVGGGGLFNVHVHTDQPGRAVDVGLESGEVRNVSIVNLEGQVQRCIGGQARAVRVAEQATALVAVAEGDGLTRTFASLGAIVVPGGPGNNPSVGDLMAAIDATPADRVVVLPNHENIVPAAERAAAESWKHVRVVRAPSIPSGLSAAAAFNPTLSLGDNARSMGGAADACRWGEVTRAQRDAETPAGRVRKGAWLGLVDGVAVGMGGAAADAAVAVARSLARGDSEILTLVVGSEATPKDRGGVESAFKAAFPNLEVQVVVGDQPRYPFLIGVE